MVWIAIQNEGKESTKVIIKEVALQDGKLKSPIDIGMSVMKPLYLDRLEWINFDTFPSAIKVTNSGETVILGAKWKKEVPYLVNGPLEGTYIFSQIHFHWGSLEGEGSEHTIDGVSYPMEMHVVFFNSAYLTQEAALKKGDGTVIVAYLVKLEEKSTFSLHCLSSHLEKVLKPHTSTMLASFKLSSLVVPFAKDYVFYWGSLAFGACSHPIQWLVSRVALGICTEDLKKFRRLISENADIVQDFHNSSVDSSRTIFHVNPSMRSEHFLLPEIFYTSNQSQQLNEVCISTVISKDQHLQVVENVKRAEKILDLANDLNSSHFAQCLRNVRTNYDDFDTPCETSSKISDSNSPNKIKDYGFSHLKKINQLRYLLAKKLKTKKETRQVLEKNRLQIINKNEQSTENKEINLGIQSITPNKKRRRSPLPAKVDIKQKIVERKNDIHKCIVDTEMDNENVNCKESVVVDVLNDIINACIRIVITQYNDQTKSCDAKSKLPRPVHYKKSTNLQSSYTKYFRPSNSSTEDKQLQEKNFK